MRGSRVNPPSEESSEASDDSDAAKAAILLFASKKWWWGPHHHFLEAKWRPMVSYATNNYEFIPEILILFHNYAVMPLTLNYAADA